MVAPKSSAIERAKKAAATANKRLDDIQKLEEARKEIEAAKKKMAALKTSKKEKK